MLPHLSATVRWVVFRFSVVGRSREPCFVGVLAAGVAGGHGRRAPVRDERAARGGEPVREQRAQRHVDVGRVAEVRAAVGEGQRDASR